MGFVKKASILVETMPFFIIKQQNSTKNYFADNSVKY